MRPNAKLLYADLNSLADSCGYCWATNAYLAENCDLAPRTVSDLISALEKRGYITVEILRDPQTNEVIERRIWIDKPTVSSTPPPAKNGDTPPADFSGTPPAKNGYKNDYTSLINNTPLPPKGACQREKRKREPKSAPDWKPERFASFWDFYSHKGRGENKQGAIRAWDRLRPSDELIATMGKSLSRQISTDEWQRRVGIPYASTWLNNARWEDVSADAPGGDAQPRYVRTIVVDGQEVDVYE